MENKLPETVKARSVSWKLYGPLLREALERVLYCDTGREYYIKDAVRILTEIEEIENERDNQV